MSDVTVPQKPSIEEIENDLASIEINENDPLFDSSNAKDVPVQDADKQFDYERLEKFVLFKINLESAEKHNSTLSLDYLNKDLDELDKHIASLKNFIEISKKFLLVNK